VQRGLLPIVTPTPVEAKVQPDAALAVVADGPE
jgi:hypothetical protein